MKAKLLIIILLLMNFNFALGWGIQDHYNKIFLEEYIPNLKNSNNYQKSILLRNYIYNGKYDFCNRLAKRYVNLLKLYGIKSRYIVLQDDDSFKTNNIRNSHTTVEVFIEKHWQIQDPTFNVHFKYNSRNLNALEMSNMKWSEISIESDGFRVIKGHSLQEYYIPYEKMLHHIFIKNKNTYKILK